MTDSGGAASSQPGGSGTLGGASNSSGGAAGSAGSSGQTQAGGASNSDPVSTPSKPCTMTAGDWCQELTSGETSNAYLITLNSQDHVILAGQKQGGGLFVAEYAPIGQNAWVHELPAGDADFVEGLTTDGNDNIFVSGSRYDPITSSIHALIAKLTPEGKVLWLREPGGLLRSTGLAVDANGNAVLATQANEVLKYSPGGDVLWRLTPNGKTGVGHPSVDADGHVLALTANATSAFLTEWSANGDPISDEKLSPVDESPTDLAFDRNGDLLAVRYEAVSRRRILWRYSRASGVVWSTALPDQLFTADQLALDARGRIFIVGMANDFGKPYYDGYLAQYDPDGKLLWGEALGMRGTSSANSLAVSRDGKVYLGGGSASGAFVMRVSPP
ncbi:MAG: hypothetical protein WDO74_06895 [Pseudomonadota bacterium]